MSERKDEKVGEDGEDGGDGDEDDLVAFWVGIVGYVGGIAGDGEPSFGNGWRGIERKSDDHAEKHDKQIPPFIVDKLLERGKLREKGRGRRGRRGSSSRHGGRQQSTPSCPFYMNAKTCGGI